MASLSLRFLRPFLHHQLQPARTHARRSYALLYRTVNRRAASTSGVHGNGKSSEVRERIAELQESGSESYPRIRAERNPLTCEAFRARYSSLQPDESAKDDIVTVRGTSVGLVLKTTRSSQQAESVRLE